MTDIESQRTVIFVAPYISENAKQFLAAVIDTPGVTVGVISQEPLESIPEPTRHRVAAHWRIDDALDTAQLIHASRGLSQRLGPIHRLLGAVEQIQVQLGEAREQLGIDGMRAAEARNFRDKSRMKELLRSADLPCARSQLAHDTDEALRFASDVGFPIVVKPNAGAASQATVRVESNPALLSAVTAATTVPGADGTVLLEEFITGEEHSFDAFLLNGRMMFHSITRYTPTPIEAMQNPWIQWTVLLPREIDAPEFDAIRDAGLRSLNVLGLNTGMCHLEWFRRRDGSVVISEVAARPPGAQITTMISRANDVDIVAEWARLMIHGEFDAPRERKYAVGAAFLRAQGIGSRITAVHGLEQANHEFGSIVCDVRLPVVGNAPAASYEGDGFVIIRHPDTAVVADALRKIVEIIRVERGD